MYQAILAHVEAQQALMGVVSVHVGYSEIVVTFVSSTPGRKLWKHEIPDKVKEWRGTSLFQYFRTVRYL